MLKNGFTSFETRRAQTVHVSESVRRAEQGIFDLESRDQLLSLPTKTVRNFDVEGWYALVWDTAKFSAGGKLADFKGFQEMDTMDEELAVDAKPHGEKKSTFRFQEMDTMDEELAVNAKPHGEKKFTELNPPQKKMADLIPRNVAQKKPPK